MTSEDFNSLLHAKLTPEQVRQVRMLEQMFQTPKGTLTRGDLANFEVWHGGELARDAVQQIRHMGLIAFLEEDRVEVTKDGETLIRKVRELRKPGPLHNLSLRRDLLAWSYDHYDDWMPVASFIGSSGALFHGNPYIKREVDRACVRLEEDGLFRRSKAVGRDVILITPTSKGLEIMEAESTPQPGRELGNQYITNIHGNGSNVAIGSSHTTQYSTVSVEMVEKFENSVQTVREAVDALVSQGVDRAQLEGHLEVASTVEILQDPQRGKQALVALRDTIVAGAGGSLGALIVQMLSDAVSAFGIF